MNTHGGQPKGWVGQIKPIPSFRTRSLKTASGYLPWNAVAVKVFPGFIRVVTPSTIWLPKPFCIS